MPKRKLGNVTYARRLITESRLLDLIVNDPDEIKWKKLIKYQNGFIFSDDMIQHLSHNVYHVFTTLHSQMDEDTIINAKKNNDLFYSFIEKFECNQKDFIRCILYHLSLDYYGYAPSYKDYAFICLVLEHDFHIKYPELDIFLRRPGSYIAYMFKYKDYKSLQKLLSIPGFLASLCSDVQQFTNLVRVYNEKTYIDAKMIQIPEAIRPLFMYKILENDPDDIEYYKCYQLLSIYIAWEYWYCQLNSRILNLHTPLIPYEYQSFLQEQYRTFSESAFQNKWYIPKQVIAKYILPYLVPYNYRDHYPDGIKIDLGAHISLFLNQTESSKKLMSSYS